MHWGKRFEDFNLPLEIDTEFYSAESDIQFNNTAVYEGYKKASHLNFTVNLVATWSEGGGIEIPQPEKYDRRNNLTGLSLTIATMGDVSHDFNNQYSRM